MLDVPSTMVSSTIFQSPGTRTQQEAGMTCLEGSGGHEAPYPSTTWTGCWARGRGGGLGGNIGRGGDPPPFTLLPEQC
jgi:hypothetical protein